MSGLIQSVKRTAKGIPAGFLAAPLIKKAKIPVSMPEISLPPQDRGIEPLSFITKKAENKAPLVNRADNISPLPNGAALCAQGKK